MAASCNAKDGLQGLERVALSLGRFLNPTCSSLLKRTATQAMPPGPVWFIDGPTY